MKPFIKPRPTTPVQSAQPESQKSSVSINELTIFALASAMSDPEERAAYLDRTCGVDDALRRRVEGRLATHQPTQHVPAIKPPQYVQSAQLKPEPASVDGPALALVPVSAMQFPALPPQLQRQVTFAWGSATLMALAVGALAVMFYFEKEARVRADALAKEANVAAENSLRDRENSEARAFESKSIAERTAEARAKAEQERDEALAKATAAAQETERFRIEADKHKTESTTASEQSAAAAKAEKEQLIATQKTATIALADSLAALANLQLAAKNFAEANASARQCLELRTGNGIEGWALVEARALFGEASLQRNADADAEREFTAAGAAIEALGAPTNDTDRARFVAASKRILRFFSVTGRGREGSEWKRRLDAAVVSRVP